MTSQQTQYYYQLLNHVNSLPPQTQFCLDNNFYAVVFHNIALTAVDKRVLGREFKKDVQNNKVSVNFNYIFGNCLRCGYKDNTNKSHYIKI